MVTHVGSVIVNVRLTEGNSTCGRVEVLHNGSWRGVCENLWNDNDAKVVCRMLGLR